jgi:hypothetical protein
MVAAMQTAARKLTAACRRFNFRAALASERAPAFSTTGWRNRMSVPRCSALLPILALAGCGFGTKDEPFSLNDGDALPAAEGAYVCAYFDDAGNRGAQTARYDDRDQLFRRIATTHSD